MDAVAKLAPQHGAERTVTVRGAVTELPTGTVTFFFTDVEGSTRPIHELSARLYTKALDDTARSFEMRARRIGPKHSSSWFRAA